MARRDPASVREWTPEAGWTLGANEKIATGRGIAWQDAARESGWSDVEIRALTSVLRHGSHVTKLTRYEITFQVVSFMQFNGVAGTGERSGRILRFARKRTWHR